VGVAPQTVGLGVNGTFQRVVTSQLLVGPIGAGQENLVAGYAVGATLAVAVGLIWLQPPVMPVGVAIPTQFCNSLIVILHKLKN
jgi:hypothetical protein